MGTELCRADRQTDMPKLTIAFRNSANAEDKLIKHSVTIGEELKVTFRFLLKQTMSVTFR